MKAKHTHHKKGNREELRKLIKVAGIAALRAKRLSTALDIPISVIEKGILKEKLPNGEVREIKSIERVKPNHAGIKKGVTICLR